MVISAYLTSQWSTFEVSTGRLLCKTLLPIQAERGVSHQLLESAQHIDLLAVQPAGKCRRVISASCVLHRGPRGFTNLVGEKRGGEIVLDPHATGSCVIILDEAAATALFDVLRQWLG